MKQWSKKQKTLCVAIFAAVLVIAGAAAVILNTRQTQDGVKQFQIEVVSERDGYEKTTDCQSDAEFLGEFLRTFEDCEWEEREFGIYITGFDGMLEDIDNQYWWCVMVNGESATTGADGILLEDGVTYNFVLKQGW